jgi:uncharacterized RmlC-like cupin family protein
MNSSAGIHIVSPAEYDPGTAQTPGFERRAAIAPPLGIASAMWGGTFEVEPGSRTGVHHHGEQETIACVLSGICEVRWRIRRAREGWRFHSRPRLPAANANQPIETGTVSMGRGALHRSARRRRPSGRHLAVSRMSSCGQQGGSRP